MKRFLLLLPLFALALCACNGSSPSKVAEGFYAAILQHDYSKAVAFSDLDSADYSEGAAFIEMCCSMLGSDDSFEVLSQDIQPGDTTAIVKVSTCFNSVEEELNVNMVRKDGQWKVQFLNH